MDTARNGHRARRGWEGTHPSPAPPGPVRARYVIRFDFPDDVGPRYAMAHPDPPHDWATSHAGELARAVSFDEYADALHVLDFAYGRRDRNPAQGHHGRVVILSEEIRGLTDLAYAAADEIREAAAS